MSRSALTPLYKLFAMLGIVLALFGGFSSPASAQEPDLPVGGQSRLANNQYLPGDLYASIIYSESSEVESADGVELNYATIMKYPAGRDDHKIYGRLDRPAWNDADTEVGGKLVSQMRTLYEYGWFEPLPQQQDNILSRIFQTVIDYATDSISDKSARLSLNAAIWGASIFDTSKTLISWFESAVGFIDVPKLLGLAPADGETTWLHVVFAWTFERMGIGETTMKVIGGFTLLIIIFIAGIHTMRALSARSRAMHRQVAQRWYLRIIVALTVVTLSTWTTMAFSKIGAFQDSWDDLASDINASYIVDSLAFAGYTNFNMRAINASGNLNADGSLAEDFKPTRDAIDDVNTEIKIQQSYRGGSLPTNSSATALLEEFASGKIATVADYFSLLGSQECWRDNGTTITGASAVTCQRSYNQVGSLSNFDVGIPNKNLYATERATNAPFFILENARNDSSSSSSSSSSESSPSPSPSASASAEATDGATDEASDKASESPSPSPSPSPSSSSSSSSDSGQANIAETKITMSGQEFTIDKNSKITVRPFDFRNPQSYIYGATPPGNLSKATKEYANYINDETRSVQWINPETGKRVDTKSTDPKDQAVRNNALHIAIYNRYAGLETMSFSDQSTAFFLQTKRSGEESIVYKGYYTAPNADGEAKNVGRYGNAFIRYVMPTTSTVDYYGKIGSLTIIWGISGALALASLLILLRAPVFGALLKSLTGFLSAFFMGNPVGLVQHLIYKIALHTSFVFAGVGVYMGTLIGKHIIADKDFFSTFFGIRTAGDGIWGFVNPANQVGVPGITVLLPLILLAGAFTFVLCYPLVKLADRNVSFLGAFIGAPYLVAESLMERFKTYGARELGVKEGKGVIGLASRADRREAKAKKAAEKNAKRSPLNRGVRTAAKIGTVAAGGALLTAATGGAGTGLAASMLTKGVKNKAARYAMNNLAQKGITGLSKAGKTGQVAQGLGNLAQKGLSRIEASRVGEKMGFKSDAVGHGFLNAAHFFEEMAQRQHFKDSPWYEKVSRTQPLQAQDGAEVEGSNPQGRGNATKNLVDFNPSMEESMQEFLKPKFDPDKALVVKEGEGPNGLYYFNGEFVDGDGNPIDAMNKPEVAVDLDGNPLEAEASIDGEQPDVSRETREPVAGSEPTVEAQDATIEATNAQMNPDAEQPVNAQDVNVESNQTQVDSETSQGADGDRQEAQVASAEQPIIVDGAEVSEATIKEAQTQEVKAPEVKAPEVKAESLNLDPYQGDSAARPNGSAEASSPVDLSKFLGERISLDTPSLLLPDGTIHSPNTPEVKLDGSDINLNGPVDAQVAEPTLSGEGLRLETPMVGQQAPVVVNAPEGQAPVAGDIHIDQAPVSDPTLVVDSDQIPAQTVNLQSGQVSSPEIHVDAPPVQIPEFKAPEVTLPEAPVINAGGTFQQNLTAPDNFWDSIPVTPASDTGTSGSVINNFYEETHEGSTGTVNNSYDQSVDRSVVDGRVFNETHTHESHQHLTESNRDGGVAEDLTKALKDSGLTKPAEQNPKGTFPVEQENLKKMGQFIGENIKGKTK